MTLAKNANMINPKKYAEILSKVDADFFELKAYMWVGYSRERLCQDNMPLHTEIVDFAEEICKNSDLKIISQKPESRVVLLMKKDREDRLMRF